MGISIAHQTQAFFYSILMGMALGVLYDIFRILRLVLPNPKWAVLIEDLLYFSIAAFAICLFTLKINQGEMRSFVLIGQGLGWVLYFFTIGSAVMAVARPATAAIKKMLHFLCRCILHPLYRFAGKILCFLAWPVRFLHKKIKKVTTAAKFSLKQGKRMLYNLIKSQRAS